MIVKRSSKTKGTRYAARVHRGKSKYEYGKWRDTEREAKIDEGKMLVRRQSMPDPTVAQLADWFLERYPRTIRNTKEVPKASTVATVTYSVNAFVREFGPYKVAELFDDPVRDKLEMWCAENRGAPRDVRTMSNDAVKARKIGSNFMAGIEIERGQGRADIAVMTAAEVDLLCDIAGAQNPSYPTFAAMLRFLAYTCIRPGEAFVLEHGDLDGETLHVKRTLGSTGEVTTPKTKRSRRSIYLPAVAAEAVDALPRLLGVRYVFVTKRDRRFNRDALHRLWTPAKEVFLSKLGTERALELDPPPEEGEELHPERLVPYSLRHFGATYLLDNGVSYDDTARQLGHTNANLVKRLYGHPDDAATRERISRAFGANVRQLQASRTRAEEA